MSRAFADRADAGRQLGILVARWRPADPVTLGLARGGVPVARAVAGALSAAGLDPSQLIDVVAAERAEARRRLARYRGGRPPPALAGRDVILVDDGLATGVSARAAVHWVRACAPRSLLLAVPVAAASAAEALAPEVDELVCVARPREFRTVAAWYADFSAVDDCAVLAALSVPQRPGG